MAEMWRGLRWLAVVSAVAVGVVVVLWLCLVAAPPWFVPGDALDERKVQNEVRTTLLQGLGGVVLGVGAYFTARQLKTSQQAQMIAREGQITERYTRAVDQLGHAEVDVRVGGIYALERIARDSPDDQPTIAEVLTSFVRGRSPWPPTRPGQFVATAPLEDVTELQVRNADVQAAITVLARGDLANAVTLDLHEVDLRKANLRVAHLEGANLVGAHLERAHLAGAHLERAHLGGANLESANLVGAHLEQADLFRARLEGANLSDAHLEHANLGGTRLDYAELSRARLEHANLAGVNVETVFSTGGTRWPAGFKPPPARVRPNRFERGLEP